MNKLQKKLLYIGCIKLNNTNNINRTQHTEFRNINYIGVYKLYSSF
jgi:hypothetical protein